MKKSLVAALTTALVVGAASTTFAAQNPFEDVPADHWAYDAVVQLANDGVIEGYGDGKFKGQNQITRYEMAQMIARAMANKPNISGNDKALLDKLAAEFGEELNNLGVRVSNLERNADKVKWNGYARYTAEKDMVEGRAKDQTKNELLLRLEPTAEINSNWAVKARIDAKVESVKDDYNNNNEAKLIRIWAQGNYGKFQTKLGKFGSLNNDTLADTEFSGAEVSYGKDIKVIAAAGRLDAGKIQDRKVLVGDEGTANYQYAGLEATRGKLFGGAYWHHANLTNFDDGAAKVYANKKTDELNIWALKGSYTFDKNVAFKGFYAQNHDADYYDKSGSAELDYKGAQKANQGTWGAWVAYRHIGNNAVIKNPFDVVKTGQKGWEIGANYTPFKNVVAQARYGNGKTLAGDKDVQNIFGRVEFFF